MQIVELCGVKTINAMRSRNRWNPSLVGLTPVDQSSAAGKTAYTMNHECIDNVNVVMTLALVSYNREEGPAKPVAPAAFLDWWHVSILVGMLLPARQQYNSVCRLHERLDLDGTYISVPDDVGYSLAIILRLTTATTGCCGTGLP